jgi:hypothetical protein
MTDAPVDELDDLADIDEGVLAALAYADECLRLLRNIWLGPAEVRTWLTSMEFSDPIERELIIGAIDGFARAARAQSRSVDGGQLMNVVDLHEKFSPHPSSGLPPVTNALSIWRASRNISIVIEARAHQKGLLSPRAVELCRSFIQRILTTKHRPGLEALASP